MNHARRRISASISSVTFSMLGVRKDGLPPPESAAQTTGAGKPPFLTLASLRFSAMSLHKAAQSLECLVQLRVFVSWWRTLISAAPLWTYLCVRRFHRSSRPRRKLDWLILEFLHYLGDRPVELRIFSLDQGPGIVLHFNV